MQAGDGYSSGLIAAERLFAVLSVLALLAIVKEQTAFYAIVALGHAHFALTYLYKWRKRRYSPKSAALYVAGLAFCFFCAYRWPGHFPVLAGTAFVFHSAFDDVFLTGRPLRRDHVLSAFIMALLFFDLLCEQYLFTDFIGDRWLFVFPALALASFFSGRRESRNDPAQMWFMLLVSAVAAAKAVLTIPAVSYYGFLILVHYINWYVKIGWRKRRSEGFARFCLEIVAANILFVCGLWFYLAHRDYSLLYHLIYGERAFFVWTMMHIVSTVRVQDFAAFRQRKSPGRAATATG